MRFACALVLMCVLPFIALSQNPADKAIIDDYARPGSVAFLKTAKDPFWLTELPGDYLVYAPAAVLHDLPFDYCTVLRRLSSEHAIVRFGFDHRFPFLLKRFIYVVPANINWKLSPSLIKKLQESSRAELRLLVTVSNISSFTGKFGDGLTTLQTFPGNTLLVVVRDRSAVEALLASGLLLFADLADRDPIEELSVSGFDLGTNHINTAHHHFPNVTGEGLVVSVKENRFDSNDTDLKGRVVPSTVASPNLSGHASIMATMIAGAGNSFYDGKGVAYRANLQSASFANLMPEPETYYRQQGISVQNHSYGTAVENFYGSDAAAYDALVISNPTLMHVFSAGNSGTAPSGGPYAGLTGFANITGSFKMAKNILTVGAIDSVGNVELPSSRGPAYDGRIKPELAAFGQDGSSGAAAVVSGIVLLMQQAYKQLHNDALPPVALIKSVLISTASDIGAKGPDYASGYGKANAYRAIHSIRQSHFISNAITQGNAQNFTLNIASGISTLQLTLAWTDPAAQANALKALVNNLDMELVHVPSGQTWHPWVLSSFPHKDSLQLPARRDRDTLNNVEHITIDAPPPGNYNIVIRGNRVTTPDQQYFVAYFADTADTFQWMYPMSADPVTGGATEMARWHSTFGPGTTGTLQYSLPNGNWQTVANHVDLSKNYLPWNAPDTFSKALLRMIIAGNNHETDTFIISKLIGTEVGFNCPDSFLFYWQSVPGATAYRIYHRGSKFLEPLTTTADTFYIASKNTASSKQFTVAPVIHNREGYKTYSFDYTTQGVECYFRSFLANLNGDQAMIQLQLGSLYRVQRIVLQKFNGNDFHAIQTIDQPTDLQSNFADAALRQGVNRYRVALHLQDGKIIYSSIETVYYLPTTIPYLIYPNPATVIGGFRILQQQPDLIRVLMHDATGRLVKDEQYQDLSVTVSTFALKPGLYFVTVVKDGQKVFRGKVIIAK